MAEKYIVLSSYDGAKLVKFGKREYPIEAVDGFRLDKDGEISWISLDSQTMSAWMNGEHLETKLLRYPAMRRAYGTGWRVRLANLFIRLGWYLYDNGRKI